MRGPHQIWPDDVAFFVGADHYHVTYALCYDDRDSYRSIVILLACGTGVQTCATNAVSLSTRPHWAPTCMRANQNGLSGQAAWLHMLEQMLHGRMLAAE